jgi:hypothetical protein
VSSWGYALDAGHLAHYGTGSFTSTVGTGTTRRLSSNASRTAVVGEFDRITVEMPTAMDMTQIHHRTAGNANLARRKYFKYPGKRKTYENGRVGKIMERLNSK